MTDLQDWRARASYLGCLILIPFLRFLIRNDYGFAYAEVLAAAGILAVLCVILGLAARGWAYFALTAACVSIASTYAIQRLSAPLLDLPLWFCAACVAGAALALVLLMRQRFFPVMAVFVLSGLALDAAAHFTRGTKSRALAAGASGNHVLWLVLDEQIGLNGFPSSPACAAAKARLQSVLDRYNFKSFPNAYSNYSATIDSVPSVLNQRLVAEPRELMATEGGGHLRHYAIRANALFERYSRNGYRVTGYQHASFKTCLPEFGSAECREYSDKLGWLHAAPGGWVERFRWLVGSYQSSDPLLVQVKGFFPFRFGLKITGPLAVADFWPTELAGDILSQNRPTLFFVHLLTPHSPYLYRRDGSIRPLEEWGEDRADERVSALEYRERYCRYCEQVEFLAGQVDAFLGELTDHGALRRMTVVIHGDHGSRIRQEFAPALNHGSSADIVMPDAWDYSGEPPVSDLIDRFSTLLAVKEPGALSPSSDVERHSLLTFLTRTVLHGEQGLDAQAADRVYLAGRDGAMRPLDLLRYWKD